LNSAPPIVGSKKLLDDQSKKEMQRTQWPVTNSQFNEEYGLGLVIDYAGNRRLFGHGGGFPGHRTKTLCDPKDKLVVVVMTNAIEVYPDEIAKGVVSVIDHFQKNTAVAKAKQDLRRLQGRLMNLWSIEDIVVAGGKIHAANPALWHPLNSAEELEYIDANTLKVVKTGGFSSEGELIHFNFTEKGRIKSVRYCGLTMWPESDYLKRIASQKRIAQKQVTTQ
jgi:hypothetical protein